MKKRFGFLVFLFLIFMLLINTVNVSAELDWFSDFGNGTGNSTSALTDGEKWTSHNVNDNLVSIVSASGLGFPSETTNVARVTGNGGAGDKIFVEGEIATRWPLPAVGEYVFYRMYFRNDLPPGMPNVEHHLVETHVGDIAWGWNFDPSPNIIWYIKRWDILHSDTGANDDPRAFRNARYSVPYSKNTTYRLEWRISRLTDSTANTDIRFYNSLGALIANSSGGGGVSSFINGDGFTLANQQLMNNTPPLPVEIEQITTSTDLAEDLQSIDLGQSGQGGSNWVPGNYMYFGNFAVLVTNDSDAWIGAYPTVEEGGTPPSDTTPPIRSSGLPSGLLPFNTTQATLSLNTNEAATCRYGTTPGTAYASIANNFTTTGSTSHSQTITGLTFNTTYNYHVRCNDTAGNFNTDDYNITFRISHAPNFTYNWNEWWTNETTNFTMFNASYLQNIANVRFVNQYGRIQFLQGLNLSSDLDLTNRIKVLDKKVWVNSSLIPEFNRSAQLTFTGVGFSNPIIKIDGVDCPITVCQNVTFNQTTGQYTFNVTGFSMYEVVEQCEDGVKNYDETGKDCGGKCGECGNNGWIWILIGILGIAIFVYSLRRGNRKGRR